MDAVLNLITCGIVTLIYIIFILGPIVLGLNIIKENFSIHFITLGGLFALTIGLCFILLGVLFICLALKQLFI